MKSQPPSKYFIILIILTILAWGLVYLQDIPQNTPEQAKNATESELKTDLLVISGNTLKAISSPIIIRTRILATKYNPEKEQLIKLINKYYPKYEELLIKLAFCESSWRHRGVWGDNTASYGIFQWQAPSWKDWCDGSRYNLEDQLHCTMRLIKKNIGHTTKGWFNCFRKHNLRQWLDK